MKGGEMQLACFCGMGYPIGVPHLFDVVTCRLMVSSGRYVWSDTSKKRNICHETQTKKRITSEQG